MFPFPTLTRVLHKIIAKKTKKYEYTLKNLHKYDIIVIVIFRKEGDIMGDKLANVLIVFMMVVIIGLRWHVLC